MSLATLFRQPITPREMAEWSFSNRSDHLEIAAAIQRRHGVIIVPFAIEPITPANFQNFLLAHQAMHVQEANVLGIDQQDFLTPNIADWWFDHADQHRRARTALGL